MVYLGGGFTDRDLHDCIDNCLNCHAICVQTANYSQGLGGKAAETQHVRLLLDCAQICQTSADFMLRGSHYHDRTCQICAELCEECADHCEKMGIDEQMRICTEICRKCANSCRGMSHRRMAA